MIKNNVLLFVLLMIFQFSFSQYEINGKIIFNQTTYSEVYIINLNSNEKTTINYDGLFSIKAKPNHVLVISGEKIDKRTIILKEKDFSQEMFFINVYPKTQKLEEVLVKNYSNINAVSLGLISKNTKSFSPAERKLKTAGKFKWYSPLLIPFGGMSVDGLINKISGRTSMLKKELRVENYEKNQKKLTDLFPESFYLENLNIPKENILGFLIYASQTSEISANIQKNDKVNLRFALIELAVKYKEIISEK